jgi:hypothetical protein
MAASPREDEWGDTTSVHSDNGAEEASLKRLALDEDAEGGDAGRRGSVIPTPAAESDASDSAVKLESSLAATIKAWAEAGYNADALAFLADEVAAVRNEQRQLRGQVQALSSRMEHMMGEILLRLSVPSSGSGTATPQSSSRRLVSVAGMRAPSPVGRSASPAAFSSVPSLARSAAVTKHPFASKLGISTCSEDDSPRTPVHIWAGTWNVGAVEPVGGPRGCTRDDLLLFAPRGYDVYALAVQEGMSDKLFDEFAAVTGTVRLRLTTEAMRRTVATAPTMMTGAAASGVSAEEAAAVAVGSKAADADKVLGRGDGSLVSLKFTGIALFASPKFLPHVRVMRVDRLSFGATEGSKGAVAAVIRVFQSTVAFVSAHLASHKIHARLVQYNDICKSLGEKVGNSFFQLNEQNHHVVFMGDFNYRCENISGDDCVALIRRGAAHSELLPRHDSMLRHRRETGAWDGYDEPPMAPTLWPTYKKYEGREPTDTFVDGWAAGVYRIKYREPVYKGGRVMDRVPGWCDRILVHSHPHLRSFMFPLTQSEALRVAEAGAAGTSLDQGAPSVSAEQEELAKVLDTPAWAMHGVAMAVDYGEDGSGVAPEDESSYDSVSDVLVCSDHSPVKCVFRLLAFRSRSSSEGVAKRTWTVPVALRDALAGSRPGSMHSIVKERSHSVSAPEGSVQAVLRVQQVEIMHGEGRLIVPQVAKLLCPAPFELDDSPPVEVRVTKTKQGLGATITLTLDDPAALPRLHALLKVQVDRSTKAHCVVPLRPLVANMDEKGEAEHSFFTPVFSDGITKLDSSGRVIHVQFQALLSVRTV